MATQAQHLYAITGGRRRPENASYGIPPEMSGLQQIAAGIKAPAIVRPLLYDLLGEPVQSLRKILQWLLRPSEFSELREADAVMRLLSPDVPVVCSRCGRPDWLVKGEDQCATCWIRYGSRHYSHF